VKQVKKPQLLLSDDPQPGKGVIKGE